MKILNDKEIIHLMKGEERYITIIPYAKFKRMEKDVKKFEKLLGKKSRKDKGRYDIRFKEVVILQLLELFSGDVEKIYDFLKMLDILKIEPVSNESEKIGLNTYRVLISELLLLYRVNHRSKLVTVLSVESPT